MAQLGEHLQFLAIAFRGRLSKEDCIPLTGKVMFEIGVNPAGPGTLCIYPTAEGKGGLGYTFFQPITESFLTWDVWEALNGGYLIICSCKLFWIEAVVRLLKAQGFEPLQVKYEGLSLDDTRLQRQVMPRT